MRLLLLLLLTGCSVLQLPPHCTDKGDGRCWTRAETQIPVTRYVWEVDRSDFFKRCGHESFPRNTRGACVMGRIRESQTCHIVSNMTEGEAKSERLWPTKRTVFEHEMEHCGLIDGIQWVHP